MKPQTEPVHSPFTKRQPYQPASTSSSMMDAFLQDKTTTPSSTSALPPQSTQASSLAQAITTSVSRTPGAAPGQQNSSSPADPQASSPLPLQQHKLKQQKKRASITTKVTILIVISLLGCVFGIIGINQFQLIPLFLLSNYGLQFRFGQLVFKSYFK